MKTSLTSLIVAATATALSGCAVEESGSTGSGSGKGGKDYTVAQQNAIESAENYVDIMAFSKAGLVQQLSSKAGDGYKKKDAKFAVNHIKVNWKKEAVEAAQGYLDIGGFSRQGLIEQLTSSAGDQYTPAQAEFAVNKVGL